MTAPKKKPPTVPPARAISKSTKPTKYSLRSTATEAQQQRVVDLTRGQGRDTYQLRSHGISHPAGRVRELQKRGYLFDVARITTTDADSFTHRGVALYTLIREPDDDLQDVAASESAEAQS